MASESEILRFVDTIHRDKEIEKEAIFLAIESAYLTSVKKKLGDSDSIRVMIDRESGAIQIFDADVELEVEDLGRIAASTGKQVLFQKIREAERDVIYDEYSDKVGQLVSGVVQRMEGPNMVVSLGKVEGFLPKSEQAPGERFRVGERIKVLVAEIKKNANRVRIILSRANVELVKALFALEVPEIGDKTIEIMGIAREPGYRTKIAVTTYDHNVDCVGACVGVRGSRIKNIVDELFGEKIDIVRWNESIEVLIMNSLKPAEISSMDLDFETQLAKVYVQSDQQSIAIGKRGQNVRLASKLTGWDIDIVMVSEEELEKLRTEEVDEEGRPISVGVMGGELDDTTGEETASDEAAGEEAAAALAATSDAVSEGAAEAEAEADETAEAEAEIADAETEIAEVETATDDTEVDADAEAAGGESIEDETAPQRLMDTDVTESDGAAVTSVDEGARKTEATEAE